MTPSLLIPCPDCDATGEVHVAGFELCRSMRPMSMCDGDCDGCGGLVTCDTCKGARVIPDPARVCAFCLVENGVVIEAEPGTTTCAECRAESEDGAAVLAS